jgi:hypothetical protein
MFEHIVHLQALHLDFGATQIGITNGNTPDGRDHAGATSTSFRSNNMDAAGNAIGGDCAGKAADHGTCSIREDYGHDSDNDWVHFQHNGGSLVNNYFHDFGHTHIDNVQGSDINQSDMGHDNDGTTTSGNTAFGDSDDIQQGDWFMHSNYLKTDGFDGPNGTGDDFVAGGRGMFGDYAVHALWTDTTTMNTDKAIPYTCHGNLDKYTFNCTHVPTAYGNNDSDNQAYWTATPIHQNYNSTEVVWKGSIGSGPNRKGDNGWQRAGNGYIRGDFGAGSVAGNCSVGDTCTVSNTFTNSGYGTVKPGADIVSGNKGIWENSGGIGNGNMNKGNAAITSKGRTIQ